jgi:hypothetical protein
LAWLIAAPSHGKEDKNPKPRIDTIPDGHPTRQLPQADPYLVKCFDILGFCSNKGTGAIPFDWLEIDAFVRRSGYSLTGWECETLIKMSRAFSQMSIKARDLNAPAPYKEGFEKITQMEVVRNLVDSRLDDIF